MEKIVVVGGGIAGTTAAITAKKKASEVPVSLITEEKYAAYSRCGLTYLISGEVRRWESLLRYNGVLNQTKIDLSNVRFTKNEYMFKIISELEDGSSVESEEYSFLVPFEEKDTSSTKSTTTSQQVKTSSSYYIYNFALGITLWLLPSPALAFENNKTKFAILKDLPLVSIGSFSAYKTFPYVYFYAGYLLIPEGFVKNSFRLGTKYLYELPEIKHFVSLGLGGFTNFKGSNGINGEIGFSFLKVLKTFEMTASYSYNYLPSSKNKFHLFSIGLFTSSFSINLNY